MCSGAMGPLGGGPIEKVGKSDRGRMSPCTTPLATEAVFKPNWSIHMKPILSLFHAIAFGCLFTLPSMAEEGVPTKGAKVGQWTQDYDAAIKLAGEKKLPVLLNFTGSDWCGWCKLMDKEVFAKDEWKKYAAENVVLVTLDFPQDKTIVPEDFVARNQELQKEFEVQGYPTYIVLDRDGKTKIGQLGAGRGKTPSSFIDEFKMVLLTSPSGIEAFGKEHPEKVDDLKAALAGVDKVKEELTKWIGTQPEQNEENNKIYADFQKRLTEANEKLAAFGDL